MDMETYFVSFRFKDGTGWGFGNACVTRESISSMDDIDAIAEELEEEGRSKVVITNWKRFEKDER